MPRRLIIEEGGRRGWSQILHGQLHALREFRDLADLNAQARSWVMKEAGVRMHGTTRQAPPALFELERTQLQPLPPVTPDLGPWHKVSVRRDCHFARPRVVPAAGP